jgi:hypothetical protein
MTSVHATTTYNVEASINAYFRTAFSSLSRPSFLPTPIPVTENMPEVTASLPSFSFVTIPAGALDIYQGRNVDNSTRGIRELGILDLSMWVSRKTINYMAQLRFMQGMITDAYIASKGGIVINDYTSTPASPSATSYRVTLCDLDFVVVTDDPNPDILRRRALVKYQWDARSSN